MLRALFEKTGNAVWISHLDLMRVFQRAFQRAGVPLVHSQGFRPRPQLSIALPLSVGVESRCELLDFEPEGLSPEGSLVDKLNSALISGVRIRELYPGGRKLQELALLETEVTLFYDQGVPPGAAEAISGLFSRETIPVEKKGKNGPVVQDILPLIRRLEVLPEAETALTLRGLVCCQNPSLNPMLLPEAIARYLPELRPDHAAFRRVEIYDAQETIFR